MTNTATTANPTNICERCGSMYGLHQVWCPLQAACSFCSVCGMELTADGPVCGECGKGDAAKAAVVYILSR